MLTVATATIRVPTEASSRIVCMFLRIAPLLVPFAFPRQIYIFDAKPRLPTRSRSPRCEISMSRPRMPRRAFLRRAGRHATHPPSRTAGPRAQGMLDHFRVSSSTSNKIKGKAESRHPKANKEATGCRHQPRCWRQTTAPRALAYTRTSSTSKKHQTKTSKSKQSATGCRHQPRCWRQTTTPRASPRAPVSPDKSLWVFFPGHVRSCHDPSSHVPRLPEISPLPGITYDGPARPP